MITAKIIKDSISMAGKRIITYELEYPRFIHSEFMTHRVFSRNAASSRAIPISKMISSVWSNPAEPIHWGRNQSGMQANVELTGLRLSLAKTTWRTSGKIVCGLAWLFNKVGAHKQIVNRILEPWSHIKVVVTSTEWDNFFYLRNHPDAQPEIHELARQMWELYQNSVPGAIQEGQWHLPYIDDRYQIIDNNSDDISQSLKIMITSDEALKLSASLCAQVSYRKADESVDKAIMIYDRLINSKPAHSSPFEHQARPYTSVDIRSGNFIGWEQYRQMLPGNVYNNYK